jgi:hypothetical protein
MRRLVLAVSVLLVAVAMPNSGAVASPADAAAVRDPVRMDSLWVVAGRRTVYVQVVRGACSRDLRLSALRQGATTVRLRFDDERIDPTRACPAVAKFACRSVVLRRSLGRRKVVDLTSGRVIPRAPKGLPAPQPCPRAPVAP